MASKYKIADFLTESIKNPARNFVFKRFYDPENSKGGLGAATVNKLNIPGGAANSASRAEATIIEATRLADKKFDTTLKEEIQKKGGNLSNTEIRKLGEKVAADLLYESIGGASREEDGSVIYNPDLIRLQKEEPFYSVAKSFLGITGTTTPNTNIIHSYFNRDTANVTESAGRAADTAGRAAESAGRAAEETQKLIDRLKEQEARLAAAETQSTPAPAPRPTPRPTVQPTPTPTPQPTGNTPAENPSTVDPTVTPPVTGHNDYTPGTPKTEEVVEEIVETPEPVEKPKPKINKPQLTPKAKEDFAKMGKWFKEEVGGFFKNPQEYVAQKKEENAVKRAEKAAAKAAAMPTPEVPTTVLESGESVTPENVVEETMEEEVVKPTLKERMATKKEGRAAVNNMVDTGLQEYTADDIRQKYMEVNPNATEKEIERVVEKALEKQEEIKVQATENKVENIILQNVDAEGNIGHLDRSDIEELVRDAQPGMSDADVRKTVDNLVRTQAREQQRQAREKRLKLRNEAGPIYDAATKGIYQAYKDGDIDAGTAAYSILDSVAKGARSIGNSIGNIGRAWSGGAMLNDDKEKSLWQQRRDKLWQNAIDTESGRQEGSWVNQEFDSRRLANELTNENVISAKIENAYRRELNRLDLDRKSKENEILELDRQIKEAQANHAEERVLNELKQQRNALQAQLLAQEAQAIANLFERQAINPRVKALELANKGAEINNAINTIRAAYEEDKQNVELQNQLASLEAAQISNLILKLEEEFKRGTNQANIRRVFNEAAQTDLPAEQARILYEYYRANPGAIRTQEGIKRITNNINNILTPIDKVSGIAGNILGAGK